MSITDDVLALVNAGRTHLNALVDEHALELARAWVKASDDLAPEFEVAVAELLAGAENGDVITAAQVHRARRLQQAFAHAQEQAEALAQLTAETTAATIPEIVGWADDTTQATVMAQLQHLPDLPTWVRLDPTAADAITARATQTIHALSIPLTGVMIDGMKASLRSGIIVGANPRTTARRILDRLNGEFNGGLARAERIARTEQIDAHRVAQHAAEQANTSVLKGWVWYTTFDSRTCISCLVKHGTEYPIEEYGPDDHQNGRCTRLPITKTAAELGFVGVKEPPHQIPDARAWFDNLTEDSQREIMGPGRLKLYQDGVASWEDMTVRRESPAWRDSWGVPTVAQLKGE